MRRAFDRLRIMFGLAALGAALSAQPVLAQSNPAPVEASKMSEEAYKTEEAAFIYGFPMVMNYATVDLLRNVTQDYMARPDAVIFLGSQHENNGSTLLIEIADRLHKRLPGMKIYAVDRFADPLYRQKLLDEVAADPTGIFWG